MLQPQILIGPIYAVLLEVNNVSSSGKGGFRDAWSYLLNASYHRLADLQPILKGFISTNLT